MRRRAVLIVAVVVAALSTLGVPRSRGAPYDAPVVLEPGWEVSLVAAMHGPVTGVAFGPDGLLYATVVDSAELVSAVTGGAPPANALGGGIWRFRPVLGSLSLPEPVVTGGRVPLGLTFGPDGTLYYSDVHTGTLFTDSWGAVFAVDIAPDGSASAPRVVLQDLPIGVHQTNQLVFGPDGLLYVGNGSSTDSGYHDEKSRPAGSLPIELAQPPERQPLSGGILRFDPKAARRAPLSALRYRGHGGVEDPVDVVAVGMRNNFGLEFRGRDLYVTFNGPNPMHDDDTLGDDLLLVVRDAPTRSVKSANAPDFGWPGCLYRTDPQTGRPVPGRPDRVLPWFKPCGDPRTTPPIATFGPHASADGMALAPRSFGRHAGDLFVALMGRGDGVHRVELTPRGDVATRGGKPAIVPFLRSAATLDVIIRGDSMYVVRFAEGGVVGPGNIWRISPAA